MDEDKEGIPFTSIEKNQLIDLVAGHTILWNTQEAGFRDHVKKDKIWRKIGQQLNKSDQQCRIRWRSIRDHYRRERKQEKSSVTGAIRIKKRARYWNKLGFLDGEDNEIEISQPSENMQNQDTADVVNENDPLAINLDTNTGTEEDIAENKLIKMDDFATSVKLEKSDEVCFALKLEPVHMEAKCNKMVNNPLAINLDTDTGTEEDIAENKLIKIDDFSTSVKLEKSDEVCFALKLEPVHMEAKCNKMVNESLIITKVEDGQNCFNASFEPDPEDEIDLFFKTMAATVKKFSPANINYAKIKILNVINEIEIRNETQFTNAATTD